MSTDPWRHRARRVLASRLSDGLRRTGAAGPHYVVCGDNPLAYRLVQELLLAAADARVTVVVPPRRRRTAGDVAEIPGARVLTAERLDSGVFRSAGLEAADALALMDADDVGNLHAALCAQDVNPRVRLVIRMFNTQLAQGVRRLFADSAVLSDAAMAAPAFVDAALGEVTPAHFRVAGRTLIAARRADARPSEIVCGLAAPGDGDEVEVLPADDQRADLVLAEATGRPTGSVAAARRLARLRRRPVAVFLPALRTVLNRKMGLALLVTLAVVAVAGTVLAGGAGLGFWDSIYFTLLTSITGAQAQDDAGVVEQVAQIALTVGGLALIPLITALVVDAIVNARLAVATGRVRIPREGHVIVVGLGNVGTRVIRRLHDLGLEVVAIDKDPVARGVSVARQLRIPMIVGDAALEETLRAASVQSCQALVVLSTDDVTNLQAALNGRSLRPDLRVVLRLFDGDFARRVQRAFGIATSHSVSYLAAPAFAALVMEREVIATIPVERHVLLVTEVIVEPGSELDGAEVGPASRPGAVRVIALHRSGEPRPIWQPPPRTRAQARDRLIVVARRTALQDLVDRCTVPPAEPVPPDGPARVAEPDAGS
jgi:Trk K+ transport system NAD-binding subunit